MKKIKYTNFIFLTIAGIINAFGVTMFLQPLGLLDGGISGTSFLLGTIFKKYLHPSFFLIVLNFPFFIAAYKKVGFEFIIYSLYAILVYSLFSFLFLNVIPFDSSNESIITGSDILLSSIFGGLLSGIGSGLVIRFGGALDGVEVMAVLFAKKIGISVGIFVMLYNVVLYTTSAIYFQSFLIPLYSILAYAVGVKTIDFIVDGLDKGKAAFIITDLKSVIPQILTDNFGRGATIIDAKGFYLKEDKMFVYFVINRFEIPKLKKIISEYDPNSFLTICDISETIGGSDMGFSFSRLKD